VLAFLALAPRYLPGLFHRIPLAGLALESITAIFWLGGSIALAAYWGTPRSCSGSNAYCGSSQAAIAFGFFLFALFCFLVVAEGLGLVRGNGQRTHA
jgi:hypothetical protein